MPTRYLEFLAARPQPGVHLFALESRLYKTVKVRLFLLEPMGAPTLTANAVLPLVLRAGSEDHPSRRDIARACEELFGASLGFNITRFADAHALAITAEFPADRFLPRGAREMQRVLALLFEILTRPAREDGRLRASVLQQEKYQLEQELKALRDDKPAFASLEAQKLIYEGLAAALPESGRIEDLPAITPEVLTARHTALLRNASVLAFVTGPVEPEAALDALSGTLRFEKTRRERLALPAPLPHRKQVRAGALADQGEQTHLVLCWSGMPRLSDDAYPAGQYADAVLGGLSVSRLFKTVREREGLAYAIHSEYHRARGALLARAAVDPAKAEDARRLILEQSRELCAKGPTSDEFDAARESLVEARKAALDSPSARVSDCVMQWVMRTRRGPKAQIKDLEAVTPAQVKAVLKALRPHSEFALLGGQGA